MPTSKKLLLNWAVVLTLSALLILFPIWELDPYGLQIVTPLAWGELGIATGYYFWKAKNENRAKYAQRFLKSFAEKYGTETALRIAEIVLKD